MAMTKISELRTRIDELQRVGDILRSDVKSDMTRDEADQFARELRAAGATVEVE